MKTFFSSVLRIALLLAALCVCLAACGGKAPAKTGDVSNVTDTGSATPYPGSTAVTPHSQPAEDTTSPETTQVWAFTLEPSFGYADISPLSSLYFTDFPPYVSRIDETKHAEYLTYSYYLDENGGRGVLLPNGTVGLDSSLGISWCPICGALCSFQHDLYDPQLALMYRSGHGAIALCLRASDLSVIMVTEGGVTALSAEQTLALSGVYRVLDPENDDPRSTPARYALLYNGAPVTPTLFDLASDFSEGLAAVCLDGSWYYIDKSGNTAIDTSYAAAYPFSEGLAAVKRTDGTSGYINSRGRTVIPFGFEETRPFVNGEAWVKYEGKWGKIEYTG